MPTLPQAHIFLTRRPLLTLLSKLDRRARGGPSFCTILKQDTDHPTHPVPFPVLITAIEDANYYTDRPPGEIHPSDTPKEPS